MDRLRQVWVEQREPMACTHPWVVRARNLEEEPVQVAVASVALVVDMVAAVESPELVVTLGQVLDPDKLEVAPITVRVGAVRPTGTVSIQPATVAVVAVVAVEVVEVVAVQVVEAQPELPHASVAAVAPSCVWKRGVRSMSAPLSIAWVVQPTPVPPAARAVHRSSAMELAVAVAVARVEVAERVAPSIYKHPR